MLNTSRALPHCLVGVYVSRYTRYSLLYSPGNEIKIVATAAIRRIGESEERAAREPSKLTARIKNSNGRSSRSAVGWNERRVRHITQWKKQMKLNRKTARARKTHSIVHLVQLRQKVHRSFSPRRGELETFVSPRWETTRLISADLMQLNVPKKIFFAMVNAII